jgi:hypothetical protein
MATNANGIEAASRRNFSKWWLPLFAGILALVVSTLILISSIFDLGEIAYIFLVVPLISVVVAISVLISAKRSRRTPSLSTFLSLPVYWVVTWIFFANQFNVRTTIRWILDGGKYKASMMKQPEPPKGELRHLEWDGWGWAGMDTNVYLVFDPADSLAAPAKSHSAGKFKGIPCEVYRVRRLERGWYSVQFYTDANWEQCS